MSCHDASTTLGTIPRFTHRGDDCDKPSDPVNIVVIGMTPSTVRSRLMGRASSTTGARWRDAGHFSGRQSIRTKGGCGRQDQDVVAGGLWERVHMRLWAWGPIDGSVGAAHHEFGITLGAGPRNAIHRPTSYDTGRDTVLNDIVGRVRPLPGDLVELDNYVRDPICSGEAAVLR